MSVANIRTCSRYDFMFCFLGSLTMLHGKILRFESKSNLHVSFHEAYKNSPELQSVLREEDVSFDRLYYNYCEWFGMGLLHAYRDLLAELRGINLNILEIRVSPREAERKMCELGLRDEFLNFAKIFLDHIKK